MGLGCYFARKKASAYLDRNCPEKARGWLEAHLGGCPACREHLAATRRISEMLARMARRETSEGRIAQRVQQRIGAVAGAHGAGSQRAALGWPAGSARFAARFAAGLALAAGLSAGIFFGRAVILPSEDGRGLLLGLSSGEEAVALYALAVERSHEGQAEGAE